MIISLAGSKGSISNDKVTDGKRLQCLAYFLCADVDGNPWDKLQAFTGRANALLEKCRFGRLYPADPYECFMMLAILDSDPMAAYLDGMELCLEKRNA